MEIKNNNKQIDTVFGYRHQNYRPGSDNNTLIFIKEKWNRTGKLTINMDNIVIISYINTYTAIIDANFFVSTHSWVKMSPYEISIIAKIKIDKKTKIVDVNEIPAKCSCVIS